jgi:hypothetical protein
VTSNQNTGGNTDPTGGTPCGNGKVDPGEACDGTDGCNSTCTGFDKDPQGAQTCPGVEGHIWNKTLDIQGSTANNTNQSTSDRCPTTSGGPNSVYDLFAHASGTLTVAVIQANTDYPVTLLARGAQNCTASSDLACNSGSASITVDVMSGDEISLFVTGDTTQAQSSGDFELQLSIK